MREYQSWALQANYVIIYIAKLNVEVEKQLFIAIIQTYPRAYISIIQLYLLVILGQEILPLLIKQLNLRYYQILMKLFIFAWF